MKSSLLAFLLLIAVGGWGQSRKELSIRKVLDDQVAAWNRGDIGGFMQGYWASDSLMFIGKNGITYGWRNTLNNYKRNYPDTAAMGKLFFTIITIQRLSSKHYYVVGKWDLQRSIGNVGGYFNLLFKKIRGRWQIIADHTS